MKKKMIIWAILFSACTIVATIAYRTTDRHLWLPIAITVGTFAYHFVMRLLVGYAYNITMKNHADVSKPWYQLHKWEPRLYQKLRVKKWKGKMPTFQADLFDPALHTWEEIAQAMCQAELVHETIAVFSFLPILAGVWFGDYPVFVITSIAAALVDLSFVMMQRYNRPRILKCANRNRSR